MGVPSRKELVTGVKGALTCGCWGLEVLWSQVRLTSCLTPLPQTAALKNVVRAQRLADVASDLAALLVTPRPQERAGPREAEAEALRRRKLDRMRAVRLREAGQAGTRGTSTLVRVPPPRFGSPSEARIRGPSGWWVTMDSALCAVPEGGWTPLESWAVRGHTCQSMFSAQLEDGQGQVPSQGGPQAGFCTPGGSGRELPLA